MRRGILILGLGAAVIAGALSDQVRADVCTPSTMHMQSVPNQPTNWTAPLITIPKFNPADGTLCMVVVRLSASVEAQIQATNTSSVPANLTASINVNANINAPAPIMNFNATPINSMQTVLNVPGSGMTSFSAGPLPSSVTQNFVAPGDLAMFVGAGQFLFFSAAGNGSFSFTTNTGNAIVNGATLASAKIEVTYWVPEPGSLSMLALGSTLLLARRRPRR